MASRQTPSQTIGPYFAYGLTPEQYGYNFKEITNGDLAGDGATGQPVSIEGRVFDGNGDVVPDALIEIWQADGDGHYPSAKNHARGNARFKGFGRQGTGTHPDNRFVFKTVKPGAIDENQAPHINVIVFMRGLLTHVYTRIYFPDETQANARDPVLNTVEESRRKTLIAVRSEANGRTVFCFDIHMQGDRETAFFDV